MIIIDYELNINPKKAAMINQELQKSLLHSPAASQWKRIGIGHHHGIATPIFSLRSAKSSGIGEYLDVMLLVDLCVKIGFDVIQLLPVNDTGPEKSPYSSISSCALHPIYLRLNEFLENESDDELLSIFAKLKARNDDKRVNYSEVLSLKEAFLKKYYTLKSKEILNDQLFIKFKHENHWLEAYSLFKTLKESCQWQCWEFWDYNALHIKRGDFLHLLKEHAFEVDYHNFVQYCCFRQMKEVKKYANDRGVFIKGDIPILISRESADVWYHRKLFRIEMSAGAPPDMYSTDGQNWGFPIYDWVQMEHENYRWWKERLHVASNLYDIYRIDHVVGFYHIWAIPPNMKGKDGQYIPSDGAEQLRQGNKIMRLMLKSSSMLPIGEDLGVVPPEVRHDLRELGICGTKVMRWEKRWNEDGSFIPVEEYSPVSMTTVSTHDSETLKIWWSNHYDEIREYCKFKQWPFVYELKPEKHYKILHDSHHSGSLFHINLLMEYLALLPSLNWNDFNEERINIPGKILDENWTYRMKPNMEEIIDNEELINMLQSLIKTDD